MSVVKIDDCGPVSNCMVYGLTESIKRAKYPMAEDVKKVNDSLTNGIRSLGKSARGEGHDQWLTGIIVQFDLTFSNKAWVEMERYHFIDFVSSQSTMHKITSFDLDYAYNSYVDRRIVEIIKEKVKEYNNIPDNSPEKRKDKYLEILYSNPAGFRLTAGITTNYRQLKTIYKQRKNHRLPEWRAFCRWIETLPYSEFLTV